MDMIKRLRNNDNLKKMNYFRRDTDSNRQEPERLNDRTQATDDERRVIRASVARGQERERLRMWFILAVSIAVFCVLSLVLLWLVN